MKISACVITKNEEINLPSCLDSMKSIASEMIVVDTGSTDRTIEIATKYGAAVYHFDWVNDFAAARNYAISKAKSDWIIFLDADEYFAPECERYIIGAIKEADYKKLDMIICMMSNVEKTTGKIVNSNPHIRIFRNHPQIRYTGAIHERVVRLDRPAQALDVQQDITIIHTGYSQGDMRDKEKGKRNLEILLQELEKKPDSSDLLFYVSESYLVDKDFNNALRYAERANKYRNSELKGICQKNYVNMLQCMIELSMDSTIVQSTIVKAIEEFPDYPDFYFFMGDYFKREFRYRDAIIAYESGLQKINNISLVQSSAIATATKVLDTVAHLSAKTKQWEKCIKYHVQVLQVDKYMYASLVNVIDVLGRFEQTDAVCEFLFKIYDRNQMRDCMYLLKASLDSKRVEISRRLFDIVPSEVKSHPENEALYKFLIGDYVYSAKGFLNLFQRTNNDQHAYGAIAAAWLMGDTTLVQSLVYANKEHPYLHVLASNVLEDSDSMHIDKKKVLPFFQYLIGTLYVCQFNQLVGIVKKFDLLLEVAELLYYQGQYENSYLFYNEYLEVSGGIPEDLAADLTYKVGDCLLQAGYVEQSLIFLEKAQSLAPKDYRIIEAYQQINTMLTYRSKVKESLRTAIKYYPDSQSLCAIFQESNSI